MKLSKDQQRDIDALLKFQPEANRLARKISEALKTDIDMKIVTGDGAGMITTLTRNALGIPVDVSQAKASKKRQPRARK